jgi:hypothetical protein
VAVAIVVLAAAAHQRRVVIDRFRRHVRELEMLDDERFDLGAKLLLAG